MILDLIGRISGVAIVLGLCFFVANELYVLWHMYIFKKRYFRGTKEQIAEWKRKNREEDERQAQILAGMIVRH